MSITRFVFNSELVIVLSVVECLTEREYFLTKIGFQLLQKSFLAYFDAIKPTEGLDAVINFPLNLEIHQKQQKEGVTKDFGVTKNIRTQTARRKSFAQVY